MGLFGKPLVAAGPRRTAAQVAARCICLEMALERMALEDAEEPSAEEREKLRLNLLEVAKFLGVEGELTGRERATLESKVGKLRWWNRRLVGASVFDDLPYLLWALGRLPALCTAAELEAKLPEIAERGFYREPGDRHALKKALDAAKLRPAEEIDAELESVAKANALTASMPDRAANVPPPSVFRILPWLRFSEWQWGYASHLELVMDVDGTQVRARLTESGFKVL